MVKIPFSITNKYLDWVEQAELQIFEPLKTLGSSFWKRGDKNTLGLLQE